jgi:hypothetical protein
MVNSVRRQSAIVLILGCTCSAGPPAVAEPPSDEPPARSFRSEDGWRSLFNGKDLSCSVATMDAALIS